MRLLLLAKEGSQGIHRVVNQLHGQLGGQVGRLPQAIREAEHQVALRKDTVEVPVQVVNLERHIIAFIAEVHQGRTFCSLKGYVQCEDSRHSKTFKVNYWVRSANAILLTNRGNYGSPKQAVPTGVDNLSRSGSIAALPG